MSASLESLLGPSELEKKTRRDRYGEESSVERERNT
jgi:hypothetical protein